jgi:hypothetical protein
MRYVMNLDEARCALARQRERRIVVEVTLITDGWQIEKDFMNLGLSGEEYR